MSKAVFLDYRGTVIQEAGVDLAEFADKVIEHSTVKDRDELYKYWLEHLLKLEKECFGDTYMSQEDICLAILVQMEKDFKLKCNKDILLSLVKQFWMYAPVFSEVENFFEYCPYPVYIISNTNAEYVRVCLKRNKLHVHEVICADLVKAFKPHKEIFEKALEVAGVEAKDAIMIGDCFESDLKGAMDLGMQCILLDRKRQIKEAPCRVLSNLKDALRVL